MSKVDLSIYNNQWYKPGSPVKRGLWYIANVLFLKSSLFPFSFLKIAILRLFGAKIGQSVVIKPCVNIKYPWLLEIGANSWIGEKVWIDNLGLVKIGKNVCISQGALLLSGNHDYSSKGFDLIVKTIEIEDGVWIGAKAIVCGGAICKEHSVLSVASVTAGTLEPYGIYKGNPALLQKQRNIL